MTRFTSGVAVAGALVLGVASASTAVGAEAASQGNLVPHEATYDMALSSSRSGSGVVGASGTMHYSFTDTCDGYAVNTRTLLSISYGVGTPVMTAWDFSTWESKDGTQYRFKVRNSRNGVLVETIDGRAEMPDGAEDGAAGLATFQQPSEHSLDLAPGTMFPTEHTRFLLQQAAEGGTLINRMVFDGSGDRGPYEISALIGGPKTPALGVGPAKAAAGTERITRALLEGPAWPMTMAFFPEGSADPMPEFQVALNYHGNGVAESVVQDFGDFTIDGTLTDLKPLDKPDC